MAFVSRLVMRQKMLAEQQQQGGAGARAGQAQAAAG